MRAFLLIPLFVLMTLSAFGQQTKHIGATLGLSTYQGDLVQKNFSLKGAGLLGGVFFKDYATPKVGLRGAINFGTFSGDDDNFDEDLNGRQFSFKSNFIEFQGGIEFAPLAKNSYSSGVFQGGLTPFVSLGFSYVIVNSSPNAEGRIMLVPGDNNPTKGRFMLPVGLGLRYYLSERITLSGQFDTYFLSGDYLDGISKSGNPEGNDLLFTGGISLGYRLNTSASKQYNLED